MNSKKIDDETMLNDLRRSIDYLDNALMFLLAERSRLIVKVGIIKKNENLPFSYSEKRELDLKNIFDQPSFRKLNHDFLKLLFKYIYEHAIQTMQFLNDKDPQNLYTFIGQFTLDELRQSIYNTDVSLCYILSERFHLVTKVGYFKKQHHLAPLALDRWQKLLKKRIKLAHALGIDPDFIQGLFNLIHEESLNTQGKI